MLHFPISQTRHLFPVAVPSGINAFLYSDLRTFRSVSSPWYLMILPYSIPRTPWNKKISNIEGVLKRKYFKRGVQQSNSPTRERILKCNSLLYSSIYFLFNHIYILQWRCLVGRCWTEPVGLPFFNHPTGSVQQKRQKMRLVGRVGRPPTVFSL
jgi:hypothetical protein